MHWTGKYALAAGALQAKPRALSAQKHATADTVPPAGLGLALAGGPTRSREHDHRADREVLLHDPLEDLHHLAALRDREKRARVTCPNNELDPDKTGPTVNSAVAEIFALYPTRAKK
jgi:hypothetical protein